MYLFVMEDDSLTFSPLIKSIERKKYKYKLQHDTLKVYDFNGWDETDLLIKYMNNDSIKLVDSRPDSIPVYKREYLLYNRKQLYDSTLILRAITFTKSQTEGSYPFEAFTITDNLDFYIRKDSGIVETSSGTFIHKLNDYKGKVTDSTFEYAQDLVRLLDFEIIDKEFDDFSTAHVYWNVEFEFMNRKKFEKGGVTIIDNLFQIWAFHINHVSKSIELNEINQVDGIGWINK